MRKTNQIGLIALGAAALLFIFVRKKQTQAETDKTDRTHDLTNHAFTDRVKPVTFEEKEEKERVFITNTADKMK